jgi:hypothetical protein
LSSSTTAGSSPVASRARVGQDRSVPALPRTVQRLAAAVAGPALVGPRAAAISRLAALGLPVCDGVVVTADACRTYRRDGRAPRLLRGELAEAIAQLERASGRRFGAERDPLLLRVTAGEADDLETVGAGPRAIDRLHDTLRAAWEDASPDAPVAVCMLAIDPAGARGVAYTRDPVTGSPGTYGVLEPGREPLTAFGDRAPAAFAALEAALPLIEVEFTDMSAVDFALLDGELRLFGARPGSRSAPAAVRIAVDLVDEGLIRVRDAIDRVALGELMDGGVTLSAQAGASLARLLAWRADQAARMSASSAVPS